MTDRELVQWWNTVHAAFMHALYRHDPEGMGSSVAAPEDEYFDEARDLMRRLLADQQRRAMAEIVLEFYPEASQDLIDDLTRAWTPPPSEAP